MFQNCTEDLEISTQAGTYARWLIPSIFPYGLLQCQFRQIEHRRGGSRGRVSQILIEEAVERGSNSSERVNVREVSLGKRVALVDRLVEEDAPLATQRHRWKLIQLGARTAHQKSNAVVLLRKTAKTTPRKYRSRSNVRFCEKKADRERDKEEEGR
ncbi:hypothetical protein RJ640_015223 [Escallonia rubra]|uniref:Uncharacterized protein n=1 Tax=Escallonia rubra TaxID=112253 RepID=A0AA88QF22_9ASTE|nr:hypothetical protein RJ640_015223 [Escallonia rubra]